MNIEQETQKLLQELGTGQMSSTAYDTSWIARLGEIDSDLSNPALEWLCENQLPDGSWGADKPFYYHDRIISTLSAMIALTHRGHRNSDRVQIEKGLLALEKITSGVTQGLNTDLNGATVGFEMIAPTLVAEAEKLGLISHQGQNILGRLKKQREIKLGLLKGRTINRYMSAAFSAEMAGLDGQHMLDLGNLQEKNGSIGHSPSATAYYAIYVKHGDTNALEYLRKFVNPLNGAPDLIPFETFEANWVLWNLTLVNRDWYKDGGAGFQKAIELLKKAWKPGKGMGLSDDYSVPDGDDTLVAYELLSRFDSNTDINTIFTFEESEHFCAYPYEANSSSSLNIHAIGTLRRAGFENDNPTIVKIMKYLQKSRCSAGYWFDKWNLSPYYTTAHAIIVCAGYADHLVSQPVDWILQTQNNDGAWGYQFTTAEETAYCIQALKIWQKNGGKIPSAIINNAIAWLKDHAEPSYPPLWIGKGLYAPNLIVRSTILSALALAEE
jgi:halimadienyl-diphosphate synthase